MESSIRPNLHLFGENVKGNRNCPRCASRVALNRWPAGVSKLCLLDHGDGL